MQSSFHQKPHRRSSNRMRVSQLALSVALAFSVAPVWAQNTTSAIGGLITTTDGSPAAGAQVTIVHAESGSVSHAVTDANGRYVARGLRPGGPYTITITKNGETEKHEGVYLQLAETASFDAKIGAASAITTVTVTGQSNSAKFNRSVMGSGTNISRTELAALASVQRNLQDYARTDPRVSQTDKGRGEMSVGGQNSRYNSITIDGVAINDTFGLEANGLPTEKQPISIDAIQSVQVNVSNYDVTQKGYTGANVNAITKSGTNDFKGSVYYIFRDDKLAGERYNATTDTYIDPPPFKDNTKGVTLGGPIIQDKLFFFTSLEEYQSTRTAPAFGPLGSSMTNVGIMPSTIVGAQSIAQNTYGIDIGTSDVPSGTKLSVRDALLKLDWNITDDHRASLRYAKTEQKEPMIRGLGENSLALNSYWWNQGKDVESVVGEWFADWTSNFSTEVKLSSRSYHSEPANNSNLPAMALSISGALPPGTEDSVSTRPRFLNFGTENSRHFNKLDTETIDAYAGANWLIDDHEIKFGGDYSKNEIFNAFLQNTKGNYTFDCTNSSATWTYSFGAINCSTATAAQVEAAVLENFQRGRPSRYLVQVPVEGSTLEDAAARFALLNYGLFAQDTWEVNPKLTLTYGVRLDISDTDSKPRANPAVAEPMVAGDPQTNTRQSGGFGIDNTNVINNAKLFQPRIGFNYKFAAERATQLRGGAGLFQGGAATVWLANPFSNTGVSTRVIGCGTAGFPACPGAGGIFSPDPATQPTSFAGASPAANVDLLEPGFRQPSVWKANLAFEHALPFFDLVFGAEYLYTKTKDGIYYQHLNLGTPTRTGTDGRQLFYTAQGYNSSCWTATGGSVSRGAACNGFRARALNNRSYNDVLLASKTDKGGGDLVTLSLSRPMKNGWSGSFAYTYTNATEVSPLTSSTSRSNWLGRAIFNPNEEVTANSAYLVKDRVNSTLTWQKAFIGNYKTTIGVFYEGRSGKPYSWTFNNDLNGDGSAGNDLMYIPSAPGSGEVVFRGDTDVDRSNENRFWEIVNNNSDLAGAAGSVVKRNSGFSPWTNSVDMRVSQEIPSFFAGHKGVLTLDFLNVGNMINKRWGRISEIGFQSNGGQARSFVNYAGLDAEGRYIYNVMPEVESFETKQSRGESQWAVQVTARYEF